VKKRKKRNQRPKLFQRKLLQKKRKVKRKKKKKKKNHKRLNLKQLPKRINVSNGSKINITIVMMKRKRL